jgi:predicted nucleic acid-binding protein
MISFDTNLVIYAANASAPEQPAAATFLQSLGARRDVVICELMLVEVLPQAAECTDPEPTHERRKGCGLLRRTAGQC